MNTLTVKIRPMTRQHLSPCEEIVRSSEPWKTLREKVDFVHSIRSKQAHVALIEGAVAGFVIFDPKSVFARGGYLRAIGVAPAVRGFGVGAQLLKFAEKSTARQAANLFLCVSSFNKSGRSFYKKQGYTKAGKLDNLIKKGVSEYIYWKRLR